MLCYERSKLLYNLTYFSETNFLVLATDGLFDVFSNEYVVDFIKKHLHEEDYGAKSLALATHKKKGYGDDTTVMVIKF